MANHKNAAAIREDKPRTWFERIKGSETPEEMAELLDGGAEKSFCPRSGCLDELEQTCHDCIAAWLREEA